MARIAAATGRKVGMATLPARCAIAAKSSSSAADSGDRLARKITVSAISTSWRQWRGASQYSDTVSHIQNSHVMLR